MEKDSFATLTSSNTPDELFDFIRGIKSRDMRTNSQWNIQTLSEKYKSGRVWISIGVKAAIILLLDNENVVRLTYYSQNEQSLYWIKDAIPVLSEPVMCDLLGKEPIVSTQATELKTLFSPYAQYRRMICSDLTPDISVDISEVTIAKAGDEEEILEMLHGEFDVLTARMPSSDLIRKRIDNEDVFVVRKNNRIAGFINFDSKGQKAALLDYIMVRSEYRKQHIGKKIWNYKLRVHNESKYYYLWVNMERQSAIRFHESNGFHHDGLVDNIFKVN